MPSADRITGLTDGDIGGLLEAINLRFGHALAQGKARRYGEIRQKLTEELSARALERVMDEEPSGEGER